MIQERKVDSQLAALSSAASATGGPAVDAELRADFKTFSHKTVEEVTKLNLRGQEHEANLGTLSGVVAAVSDLQVAFSKLNPDAGTSSGEATAGQGQASEQPRAGGIFGTGSVPGPYDHLRGKGNGAPDPFAKADPWNDYNKGGKGGAPEPPPGMGQPGMGCPPPMYGMPSAFGISTPPDRTRHGGGKGSGEDSGRLILDKKLAQIPKHVYDEKDVFTWSKHVRNYFIGQNSGMKAFITWIEAHGQSEEVTPTELEALEWHRAIDPMSDLGYAKASEAMWSWLNIAIGQSASAQLLFDLVEPLNGAELWRQLVQPTNSKSLIRRNFLGDKCRGPKSAPSFGGVMPYVRAYEQDVAVYYAAGGVKFSDEDRRGQLMKILPSSLSMEMSMTADDKPSYAALREWMTLKATFIQERGGKEAHLAEAELHDPPAPEYEQWHEEEPEQTGEDDATAFWLETEATDEEALAFVRKGNWRTKGKG